jgi:hypothetical protein
MLAKARLALIALLLVVGHAAAPEAVRASTSQEITFETIPNTSILYANKTITFVDPNNLPVAGLTVSWTTLDRRYYSSISSTTNKAGQITYPKILGGELRFYVEGSVGEWWGYGQYHVFVGVAATRVSLGPPLSASGVSRPVVHVKMPDGTGIPGAMVVLSDRYGSAINENDYSEVVDGNFSDTLPWSRWGRQGGNNTQTTNANGDATFQVLASRYDGVSLYAYAVVIEDGVGFTSEAIQIINGEATILVDQLPIVDLLAESAIVNFGAPQVLTAFARDVDGSPIVGSTLTLSASVSGASAACSGRKTTATTNSSGRATFKVCPVKSATWSVDGQSVVGSAGVKLTVQLTPTAPRTLVVTPKAGTVSLAWVAPAKANARAVTDYIVQYRREGATTWITFRDGISTARKATVTSLTSGAVYEFRIAARSKAGTGTWSSVVLGTPK